MRGLLLLLIVASCTQHADGTCLWVPGDDGTCATRDATTGGGQKPPPAVHFGAPALTDGRLVMNQSGAEGDYLLSASLDPEGRPLEELAPLAAQYDGAPTLWPGPAGALLTMQSNYHLTASVLDAAGTASPPVTLSSELYFDEVTAVFDGEAYLIAWKEQPNGRVVVQRVHADGSTESRRVLSETSQAYALSLASDGLGGAVVVVKLQRDPVFELRAFRLSDGSPTESLVVVDNRTGCVGDHALVHVAGGYRVWLHRCGAVGGQPGTVVEIDVATGIERPSPLPFAEVSELVPGRDGFFTMVGQEGWLIDGAFATATRLFTLSVAERFLAAGATGTGYVIAVSSGGAEPRIELRSAASAGWRETIAADYVLPDEGCSSGRPTTLVPVMFVLVLLFVGRRSRRADAAHRRRCIS